MAEDSGGLGGLLGWFGRGYDPQAAYEGLLSSQPTQDALRARSLASIAQAFGAGAGSDARGSAIPFGTTMGNAAAAAYSGQDALIAARNVAAEQQLHQAQAGVQRGILSLQPIELEMYRRFAAQQEKEAGAQKAGLSPKDIIAGGGGGTPQVVDKSKGTVFDTGDPDLNLIAHHESGFRPNVGWGDTDLSGYKLDSTGFPNWPGKPGPAGNSTAAGLFQITGTNWHTYAPPLIAAGVIKPDFSVESQIAVAKAMKAKNGMSDWLPYNPSLAEAYRRGDTVKVPGSEASTQTAAATPSGAPPATSLLATPPPNLPQPIPPPGAATVIPPGGGPAIDIGAAARQPPVVPPAAAGSTALPTPTAPLIPQGAVGGEKLSGLLGTQPDPVTAQTLAALRGTVGSAPGVTAAARPEVASLLNGPPPVPAAPPGGDIRTALGAAGAAPQVPPQLQSLLAQAGGGAPPIPQGGVPQGPPPVVSGAVGTEKGGGLLNAPPPQAPPPAPPVVPPAAVPPAAAPAMPPMPAMPTMPPIPTTMPAMPNFTPPAPTTLEGMAQAITGISSLTGHPAPAFMQELAKMPAQKAMEAYKAYVTGQANMLSEQYKKQLEITGAGVISQLQAQGALPSKLTELTTEQNLRLRNALAEKGLVFENGQYRIDPSWLSAEAQRQQQQVEFDRRKALATEGTKTDIKNRDQVIDEAKSAQLEQVTLNNMRNNAQNIYTGPYADYKNYLNRILVSTGLDPSRANAVASFEDFTKNSGQLVRQAVQQTSARAAVQEFKLIAGALPTTDTSPLGLQRVLGEYQGLANYRLAKLEAQTAYENRPGSMGAGDTSGFEAAFAKQVSPYAFVVDHMSQADRQALFSQVMKQEGGKQELQRLQEQLSYMHGQGWGRTQ